MSSFAEESTSFGRRSRTPAVHLSTHGQVTDYLLTLRSYGLTDPIPQDLVTGALSTVLNDWFSVFGLALGQAVLDIVKIVSPMSATAYRHSPSFPVRPSRPPSSRLPSPPIPRESASQCAVSSLSAIATTFPRPSPTTGQPQLPLPSCRVQPPRNRCLRPCRPAPVHSDRPAVTGGGCLDKSTPRDSEGNILISNGLDVSLLCFHALEG